MKKRKLQEVIVFFLHIQDLSKNLSILRLLLRLITTPLKRRRHPPERNRRATFYDTADDRTDADDKFSKAEVLHKRKNVVVTSQESEVYVKQVIPKSDAVKNIIVDAIKFHILFHVWNTEEIL